jgi:flagellar hook-associated protein 2
MSMTIDTSNRITGLSSGLETDTMVEGMLSSYQMKFDKQAQKTTKLEWTAESYREINSLIKNFRSQYLSVLSETNMMTDRAYNQFYTSIQTDTDAVTISASSSARACTMTIDSITQLAEAAHISSEGVFTGEKYRSDTTLGALELANPLTFDEAGSLSFSINGETFSFSQDTTIAEMMRDINSSDAGVTMRYSSLTKGFSLTSDTTGSESTVNIINITGNAFAAQDSALGIAEGIYAGQDAICSIEGIAVTQSANTFSYDGITYTLTDTSDTPIEFSVCQDYQGTVDSIVSFVDAYNQLVDKLQSKVKENIYYDYPPLTDAQKEDMTEDEIEKWEEKAKSGTLHGDAYISSLLTTLRSAFYTTVEGTGMKMSDIGLTTGTYSDGAKITVNKDKLLAALKEDPEAVKSMFVQTSDANDFDQQGLVVRISSSLLNYTQKTTDIALDSLEERITMSEEKQEALETRMEEKEKALWKKFSEMEAALAQLNSLSGWLSTLFVS